MGDKKLSAEDSQKYLLVLLNQPENRNCADCLAKGPRWASANLGVFVCIKCSGIHRSLGVHISQVRSVSLDKWTPEQLETMKRIGNGKAAEVYEAGLPENFRRPTENDTYALEQFIREKYERKLYYKKSTSSSSTSRSSSSNKPSSTPQKSTKPTGSSSSNVQPISKPLITEELIQWETSEPTAPKTNNNGFGFDGFTAFTGANVIGDDVEFSGFQSASTSASNILHSPRQNTTASNFDAESAFFSGVTSTTNANINNNINSVNSSNNNNNAPKPGKDAILQLYNQPISGGINTGTNNSSMGMNKQMNNVPVTQANYNVRVPSLGLGTGGVTAPNVPVPYNMNVNVPPMMYSNNGMMNQPVMYGNVTPPGYVNPVAANMMMNMNMNSNMNSMNSTNYVNPNYLKMMNGGVNSSSNSMNMNMNMSNKPLF